MPAGCNHKKNGMQKHPVLDCRITFFLKSILKNVEEGHLTLPLQHSATLRAGQ